MNLHTYLDDLFTYLSIQKHFLYFNLDAIAFRKYLVRCENLSLTFLGMARKKRKGDGENEGGNKSKRRQLLEPVDTNVVMLPAETPASIDEHGRRKVVQCK